MTGAIHLVLLFLLAALGSACATSVDVVFDEREDLSQYRTWNWLPRTNPEVDPSVQPPPVLNRRLARLIEDGLEERGFRRAGVNPDFYVIYQLAVRERVVEVDEPSAIYELSSHHSSPSFVVEGTRKVIHRYSELQLAIGALRARGRTLWHGSFEQSEREHHALKLDEAVALLLDRFPHHHPGRAAAAEERRRACAEAADNGAVPADEAASSEAPSPCPEEDRERRPGEPTRPAADRHTPA